MGFKRVLKENPKLEFPRKGWRVLRTKIYQPLYYIWHDSFLWFGGVLRHLNIVPNSKYKEIKKYKSIHKGKRCFIIGTGPSLKIEDLEMLKGEITFASNSIFRSFDQTKWRPAYYMLEDGKAYQLFSEESSSFHFNNEDWFGNTKAFLSDSKMSWPLWTLRLENVCYYPMVNFSIVRYLFPRLPIKYKTRFGSNMYAYAGNAGTVSFALLQFAVYMGIKEIYLLGMDCDYLGKQKHFSEPDQETMRLEDMGKKRLIDNAEWQTMVWNIVKKYADKNHISIYNATRGGKLEIFPRIDLDEVNR